MKKLLFLIILFLPLVGLAQSPMSTDNTNNIKLQSTSQLRSYNMFQEIIDRLDVQTATGTNTYVISGTVGITSYSNLSMRVLFTNGNTASSTLNVNSLGAKTLKNKSTGANLVSGDLVAGGTYTVSYDGTNLQVDLGGSGGSGTVSTVSVVSANGLAGTVANPTTTPAITLSTTLTGLVKGNGTAFSAASAGTDYQAPITLTTTGTSGAATFTANTINIPDYSKASEIGALISETWTNLSVWSNVGTPSASVAGNALSFTGTPSNTTNYITNNYGKSNLEKSTFTYTVTVGTINSTSHGIGFGLMGAGVLSQFSVEAFIELSTTGTGNIVFNANGSLIKTSVNTLSGLTTGSVISCRYELFPNKVIFTASSGGNSVSDVLYIWAGPGFASFTLAAPNAYFYSFLNHGGNHTVGAWSAVCRQRKNIDLLVIGNSIASGYGSEDIDYRMSSKLEKRYVASVEVLARPSNVIADLNTSEITLFNPSKILLWVASNDVFTYGAATSITNLATLVSTLNGLGYSTANGKLVFTTEIPRTGTAAISTYNASLISTYGLSHIIDYFAFASIGTSNLSNSNPRYSFDGTHPSAMLNAQLTELTAEYFGFVKNTVDQSDAVPAFINPGVSTSFIGKNVTAISATNSQNFIGTGAFYTAANTYVASLTDATLFGAHTVDGFGIYTNTGLTIGTSYTPTLRFSILGGNLITGSTNIAIYRNTNAGGDVLAKVMIDPVSSLTSGIAYTFDATNGFGFTQGNATRRIQGAAIKPSGLTSTAGSEVMGLDFLTQSGGTAATSKMTLSGAGNLGIGLSPTSTLTIKAGSAIANTAPLQLTAGPRETVTRAGVLQYNTDAGGDNLLTFAPTSTVDKVVALYNVTRATAQTAANASVATWTVGANDGTFMVSANILVTTSTTHSFTATCTYTDEGNTSRTATLHYSKLDGTVVTSIDNAAGAVPYNGVALQIRCKAATTITIATTGTFTTVTYNIGGSISQIN